MKVMFKYQESIRKVLRNKKRTVTVNTRKVRGLKGNVLGKCKKKLWGEQRKYRESNNKVMRK